MPAMRSTIVALSSGAVPSGVAVIRLSGPKTRDVISRLAGSLPEPRRLVLKTVRTAQGEVLDKGLVVFFPSPNSFTGEDCAEFHLHGSRAVVDAVIREIRSVPDVELAMAGAFTRRAFEFGKLDLTQVEGIGDLIASETETQRRQALKRSSGELGQRIAHWRNAFVDLRAEVEARLDFSDEEDVAEALPEQFRRDLEALEQDLRNALSSYEGGRITREGFRVVIAGAPNAGKSSLLNALAGSEDAIVSPEAGTTRDVKEVQLNLSGVMVRLFDVAGLRKSVSLAELEGVRRAERAMKEADLVLWLKAPDTEKARKPDDVKALWTIASKADLYTERQEYVLSLSCRTGAGISALKERISEQAVQSTAAESVLISHLRDKQAIERSLSYLAKAGERKTPDEILAEDLRLGAQELARLTGEIDAEQVLDRLFAGFCIGK